MANPWENLKGIAEEFYSGSLRARGLRFGLGFIRGSEVKQQFYCEQRLDYAYSRGDVDLEHRENIARRIVSLTLGVVKRPVIKGWIRVPLIAVIEDVPVIASPDAILVNGDRVEVIVKASITEKPNPQVYRSDTVLAYLHLAMLHSLGFRVNSSKYYIVRGVKDEVFKALVELKNNGRITESNVKAVRIVYDEVRAREILSWAMAYWKKLRPPKPMPSKAKCSTCPYREVCPYSIR